MIIYYKLKHVCSSVFSLSRVWRCQSGS